MAQMCGATAIKYYLPTVFLALGLSKDFSLMAGGIESTLKIGCTLIAMILIDRLGRRKMLAIGCGVMSAAMLVCFPSSTRNGIYFQSPNIKTNPRTQINGALPERYPNNSNHASDYVCIVFIFFFSFGYSVGFGPNAWVYGTEIFPTHVRAKGLNFAASGGAIGSIIVAQFFPVAIQNIGSRTYFIFFAINMACLIVRIHSFIFSKGYKYDKFGGDLVVAA